MNDLELYVAKIVELDTKFLKWGNSFKEQAITNSCGSILGRDFLETVESYMSRKPQCRALRDWVCEKTGKGISDELALVRKNIV